MDILTSVLSDLVDQLCIEVSSESNVIVNCENLLNSGLEKLNKLPEDDMDELDPFQRNAQSISMFNMGVATPWPKGAMPPPPPIILEKKFFYTFWRILCIELPFI